MVNIREKAGSFFSSCLPHFFKVHHLKVPQLFLDNFFLLLHVHTCACAPVCGTYVLYAPRE